MPRTKEENRIYMAQYMREKRARMKENLTPSVNVNPSSSVNYIEVDERMVEENILLIVNNPKCSISDRLRACFLAKDLLKEKDSLTRKPRPLLPPAESDVHGFTS